MGFDEPIIHIDMDAFFVECERLDDQSLRGKPVLVGGAGPRGVVASASYEARQAGARSAMPMGQAVRLCPTARVVPPRHHRYREISEQVFGIIRSFTPDVEAVSVDEAFLDTRSVKLHHPSSEAIATLLRQRIRADVGIPASAGIATNKLLAKLASERAKPDGQLRIPKADQLEFLHGLDVAELWGVGEATRASLERLGVVTVGDLASLPERSLRRALGDAMGSALHRLALGHDERPVVTAGEAKSISVEMTYDVDILDADRVHTEVIRHADRAASRFRRAGLAARTITLKVRFADFSTITRSITLPSATDVGHDVVKAATSLLDRAAVAGRPVRLIGVGGTGLTPAGDLARQLSVDRPAKWDDLADAIDSVRSRFGSESVTPASTTRPENVKSGRSEAGGGPYNDPTMIIPDDIARETKDGS
ncbi:MAG: DNA polymerase IV [Acidimicrobiia bacterium]|nr:DNA polymerase IV [Acidimicrobiia bacterium]